MLIAVAPGFGTVLVVGGGKIALRKVRTAVDGGFAVVVVAPKLHAGFRGVGGIEVRERAFEDRDLDGVALAFACADSREVNRRVGELARARGILVNVADRQEESTFTSPAIHRAGQLLVGVTTGGLAPGVAAEIRDSIAAGLGPDWEQRVAAAAKTRRRRRGEESATG